MGFLIHPYPPITTISDSKVISYYIPPSVCRVPPIKKIIFMEIGASAKPPIVYKERAQGLLVHDEAIAYAALWGLTIISLPPQVIIAFLRRFMVSVAYLVCFSFKPLSLELRMLLALW